MIVSPPRSTVLTFKILALTTNMRDSQTDLALFTGQPPLPLVSFLPDHTALWLNLLVLLQFCQHLLVVGQTRRLEVPGLNPRWTLSPPLVRALDHHLHRFQLVVESRNLVLEKRVMAHFRDLAVLEYWLSFAWNLLWYCCFIVWWINRIYERNWISWWSVKFFQSEKYLFMTS